MTVDDEPLIPVAEKAHSAADLAQKILDLCHNHMKPMGLSPRDQRTTMLVATAEVQRVLCDPGLIGELHTSFHTILALTLQQFRLFHEQPIPTVITYPDAEETE